MITILNEKIKSKLILAPTELQLPMLNTRDPLIILYRITNFYKSQQTSIQET